MSKFTEATLVGVFGPAVLDRLSKPLLGARWRHAVTTAEGFVSDVLTYCAKNINPDDLVKHVEDAIGDQNAVLVIDDDQEEGPRAIVYHFGKVAAEASAPWQ